MGTSASSKGSGAHQPMVPPWADDQPNIAIASSPPMRFRAFRTSFGKYLKNGNNKNLHKALGHYAKKSTGGSTLAPRRFGSIYSAGSELYDVLHSLSHDGRIAAEKGLSKSSLIGQPLNVVCQRFTETLAPENGDKEKVIQAIDEAMLEVLGEGDFDPEQLTAETINRILGEFLSQSIFQEIVEEVGGAWANSPNEHRTAEAEGELLELIRVMVDKRMAPRMPTMANITQRDVCRFMRETVVEIWQEWENNE